MPDFGYAEDNYLLEQHSCKNKWSLMTGFVGDSERFSQLMNYIKLAKIESEMKDIEVSEAKERKIKAAQLAAQKSLKAQFDIPEQIANPYTNMSAFDDLIQLQKESKLTLDRFRNMTKHHQTQVLTSRRPQKIKEE